MNIYIVTEEYWLDNGSYGGDTSDNTLGVFSTYEKAERFIIDTCGATKQMVDPTQFKNVVNNDKEPYPVYTRKSDSDCYGDSEFYICCYELDYPDND